MKRITHNAEHAPAADSKARRRGAVLILVLWAVIALSIIGLNFASLTRTHLRLAGNFSNRVKLRLIAAAGVERAIAELLNDEEPVDHLRERWADNEEEFFEARLEAGLNAAGEEPPSLAAHFSLVRNACEGTIDALDDQTIGYGLEDEASKINLLGVEREMLLRLAGMDNELADALTDWQDTDFTPQAEGAESAWYETLPRPYLCKDGPLTTLEELLLVRGFDAEVLYGEDWNRNGVLDECENDGEITLPPDNQDNVLDRGLLPFITLYSIDKNVTLEDDERVNVNSADEKTLQQNIPGLSEDEAKAIVAYRDKNKLENLGDLLKVTPPEKKKPPENKNPSSKGTPIRSTSEKPSNGNKPSSSGSSRGKKSLESDQPPPDQKKASSGNSSSRGNSSNRGGSSQSNNRSGNNSNTSSKSNQPIFDAARLKLIIDYVKIDDKDEKPGRININTAPPQVLAVLPGITEDLARNIIDLRRERDTGFNNIAELLDVSGMKQETFIPLSNLVTVRSFQFRVQSVAKMDELPGQITTTAIIDRSNNTVKVLYWNEH